MNILIIGAPGAGKGTMSEFIIEKYNVEHISTGDILRNAVKNKTDIGLKAKSYMEKGELVPDEVINQIIDDKLSEGIKGNGFLFDGYPRTIKQAESLDKILDKLNLKIDKVINLIVEDEILVKRVTGRRSCSKCGSIYNIYFKVPNRENVCDICGSELTKRFDDNEDSLKVRLSEYHKNTQPVIQYYLEKNILSNIDADRNVNEVLKDIEKEFEGFVK